MLSEKASLFLHPVRMRILLAISGREMTPSQLQEALPDVPQATLYRQIKTLHKAGLLIVVDQYPVRGALEKVYAVPPGGAHLSNEDIQHASREDHLKMFTFFMTGLLADFDAYLRSPNIDLLRDRVGFSQVPLYLNDEEMDTFAKELGELILPLLENKPGQGRRRRLLSTVMMPAPRDNEETRNTP